MILIFGLIYTAIMSIGVFWYLAKEKTENEKCKKNYKHSDGITYTDNKGRSRLLSNDEIVFYSQEKGDYVLKNKNGYIYKNFSEEERRNQVAKQKEEAKRNFYSTFCIDDDNHKYDWICQGKRFKDIKTGDVYVIRCIKHKYYYMDISNGFLIRKTDWQIKKDKEAVNKRYIDDNLDINEFNIEQQSVSDKRMLYRNFNYSSSYDCYK